MPPTEDYQANWRGARRYQFDEEYRRKKAALDARAKAAAGDNDQPEVQIPSRWTQPTEIPADAEPPAPLEVKRLQVKSTINVWWLAAALAATSFVAVFAGPALMFRVMTLFR